MDWFNVFGLVFIAVIMIPNIIFAIKNKEGFENKRKNRFLEVAEQIGRIGCFVFMIINIPEWKYAEEGNRLIDATRIKVKLEKAM